MRAFMRRYGAHPLNLLALLASFALAGYAARLLLHSNPVGVIAWFVGAAIGHDLLMLPLYAIADGGLARLWRRHPSRLPMAPWINYLRVPVLSSALLLLVYLPSIARLSPNYQAITGLSSAGYLNRWLAVTGAMFVLSALAFAIQLRRKRTGPADADRPGPKDADSEGPTTAATAVGPSATARGASSCDDAELSGGAPPDPTPDAGARAGHGSRRRQRQSGHG